VPAESPEPLFEVRWPVGDLHDPVGGRTLRAGWNASSASVSSSPPGRSRALVQVIGGKGQVVGDLLIKEPVQFSVPADPMTFVLYARFLAACSR
jgi:hypothetical protein